MKEMTSALKLHLSSQGKYLSSTAEGGAKGHVIDRPKQGGRKENNSFTPASVNERTRPLALDSRKQIFHPSHLSFAPLRAPSKRGEARTRHQTIDHKQCAQARGRLEERGRVSTGAPAAA